MNTDGLQEKLFLWLNMDSKFFWKVYVDEENSLIMFRTLVEDELVEREFPLINSTLLIEDIKSLLWQKDSTENVYVVDGVSSNDRIALTELEIILTKHKEDLASFDEPKTSILAKIFKNPIIKY